MLVAPRSVATEPPHSCSRCCSFLRATSGLLYATSGRAMTSQNGGGEREPTKNGCGLELQLLFNGKNSSDSCHVRGHSHLSTASHQLNRRTYVDSSTVNLSVRCSANSFCTPHSIEDILSRPRRVHVTSLLLPEARRTSDAVGQGRLQSWSMRSSEDVQGLAQRTGDDDLTWKSMYWSQHSPTGSQARLSAATSARRGMIQTVTNTRGVQHINANRAKPL